MSLNGLDSPDIQDAAQVAIAEPGGWFLLKYISRDAVELLARGKHGVSEARNAISGYTEASPLYGLLLYRRRKILIKYMPEGTSRLLQARTAVHLQDVLERYSPYETLLEITTPDGLNDTSLAASFQLHTASPSPSFNRLDEIQEDGEDSGASVGQGADAAKSSSSLPGAQRNRTDRRLEHLKKRAERAERASLSPTPSQTAGESALPVERAPSPLKTSMSQYLVREESGHTSITELESPFSAAPGEALSRVQEPKETEKEAAQEAPAPKPQEKALPLPPLPPRESSLEAGKFVESAEAPTGEAETQLVPQEKEKKEEKEEKEGRKPSFGTVIPLERSSTIGDRPTKASMEDDPYDLRKYDEWFKPKVKLAPRPVNSPDKSKKPAAARVSALPANFKPAMKKQEPSRPKSSGHGSAPTASIPRAPVPSVPTGFVPPPIPETPEYKPRPISRGSVKSAPSHKSTMTPDKLRLMKAIELRKKQLRKSQEQQATKPSIDDAPEVPKIPEVLQASEAPGPSLKQREAEAIQEQETDIVTDDESHPQSTKADSGIEIRSDKDDSQDDDLRGELIEQMPVLQEQSPQDASHAMVGEHASPPESGGPSKDVEDIVETQSSEQQGDEVSSGESQTTERPERTDQLSEEAVLVPQIIMTDGSRPTTSDGAKNKESEHYELEDPTGNSENLDEPPTSPRRQNSDLAKRRRGFVEPIQVEVPSGNPDDFLSDDDDLLDELHDATFEEATPIMVARSPLATGHPIARKASADGSVRSVNIQRPATAGAERSIDDRTSPDGAFHALAPTPPPEKYDPVTGLARNVSSGISKRIQALEAAGYSSVQARPLTPETSPGGYQEAKERKASAKRPTSFRRHSSTRASQMPTSHSSAPGASPSWNIQHDPATNRNSVSVTARIVRPSVIDESETEVGPLQHSELIMNRQRESATTTPTTGDLPSLNTSRTQSIQSLGSTQTLSPVLSKNSGEYRALHSESRFGRHKQTQSPALDDFPPPPSTAKTQSQGSLASNDENVAPKEGGRTSRFFKRMSTIPFGNSKRKSAAQSQASSTSWTSSDGGSKPNQRISVAAEKDTPPAVVVGDLNVQFPDSLLWKRRIVTIDDSGSLQFAIAQAMDIHKGVALKRFPLTDFNAPYAPDPDSQELPYSVVLEFHDGTTLQAACEDAMTQRHVLYLLKTYWKAWTA